jgi:hypothetical protein
LSVLRSTARHTRGGTCGTPGRCNRQPQRAGPPRAQAPPRQAGGAQGSCQGGPLGLLVRAAPHPGAARLVGCEPGGLCAWWAGPGPGAGLHALPPPKTKHNAHLLAVAVAAVAGAHDGVVQLLVHRQHSAADEVQELEAHAVPAALAALAPAAHVAVHALLGSPLVPEVPGLLGLLRHGRAGGRAAAAVGRAAATGVVQGRGACRRGAGRRGGGCDRRRKVTGRGAGRASAHMHRAWPLAALASGIKQSRPRPLEQQQQRRTSSEMCS